jgi:hypothetical protein
MDLKDPLIAATIAAIVTALYIYFKAKLNNQGGLPNSYFIKPAVLNGILVYFIVSAGGAKNEALLTEPF